MAIVVGDRRYVTLNDHIHVNGTKVLEAYANGVKVYPERSLRLEGNPYVVKYCGGATFSFDRKHYCTIDARGYGSRASKGWFTLSVAFSVVLAIYTDSASSVVLGDTYQYSGIPDRLIGRKAVLHGAISKAIVLDMTTSLQTTGWSVESPVGSIGIGKYGIYWFTPAGFASMMNGIHHGGSVDDVVSENVLLTISGKNLYLPDKLVTSDAVNDPIIIDDMKGSPYIRSLLDDYVSAENLYAKFTNLHYRASGNQSFLYGVSVVTTEMMHVFNKGGVFGDVYGYGSTLQYTRDLDMPITDILYCGLASDLEQKYDFTTSKNDFKNRK